MSQLDQIYHYEPVTDLIGSSGQPTIEQFQFIADAGYKTVINLALATSDNAIATEGTIVSDLNMVYTHIPVDFENPTMGDLTSFCGVMQNVEADKVWVHCVVNARVSAFLYLYLRYVNHLPEAQCRTALLDRWEPQMDEVWKEFLATGANTLT